MRITAKTHRWSTLVPLPLPLAGPVVRPTTGPGINRTAPACALPATHPLWGVPAAAALGVGLQKFVSKSTDPRISPRKAPLRSRRCKDTYEESEGCYGGTQAPLRVNPLICEAQGCNPSQTGPSVLPDSRGTLLEPRQ